MDAMAGRSPRISLTPSATGCAATKFRPVYLAEAIALLLNDEIGVAKIMLKDYANALLPPVMPDNRPIRRAMSVFSAWNPCPSTGAGWPSPTAAPLNATSAISYRRPTPTRRMSFCRGAIRARRQMRSARRRK